MRYELTIEAPPISHEQVLEIHRHLGGLIIQEITCGMERATIDATVEAPTLIYAIERMTRGLARLGVTVLSATQTGETA